MRLKRVFDLVLSVTGFILSLPLWFIFVFAIWIEDGGSVFYSQERAGLGLRVFKSLKFRSMMRDAEKGIGPQQAKMNDPRITRIGRILRKTAMDELPQLWNIIRGDMSFVGPRALRPVEMDSDDPMPRSIFDFPGGKERSSVLPGLTGVAQVLVKRNISRSEKFKYDLWYVRNRSFSLDLYLIALSFMITLKGGWGLIGDKLGYFAKDFKAKVEREL